MEKNSYLHNAHTVNHQEDLKLKKSLTLLDLHQSLVEKNFSNDIFEAKKLAFKLKCDAKNIEREKIDNFGKIIGKKQDKKRSYAMKKFDSLISLAQTNGSYNQSEGDSFSSTERDINDTKKALKTVEALRSSDEQREKSKVKLPNLDLQKGLPKNHERCEMNGNTSEGNDITQEKSNKLPKIFTAKINIKCSTTKDLQKQTYRRKKSILECSEGMITMKDYWVGDPVAIGSVRRPRKNVEEVNSRSRSMDKVHKLVRELPTDCSRSCNKPMSRLESLVSSQQSTVSAVDFAVQRRAFVVKHPQKSIVLPHISKHYQERKAQEAKEPNNKRIISGFDLKYFSSVFRKNAMKKVADSRKELHKKNKEIQMRTQLVKNRSSMKAAEQLVVDVNKSTRIQVGYTFDPLGPFARGHNH